MSGLPGPAARTAITLVRLTSEFNKPAALQERPSQITKLNLYGSGDLIFCDGCCVCRFRRKTWKERLPDKTAESMVLPQGIFGSPKNVSCCNFLGADGASLLRRLSVC